jgi:hypothetical protein
MSIYPPDRDSRTHWMKNFEDLQETPSWRSEGSSPAGRRRGIRPNPKLQGRRLPAKSEVAAPSPRGEGAAARATGVVRAVG